MESNSRAIDLAYSEYNEGATTSLEPPIIILHCLTSNRKHWDTAASYLAGKTGRTIYCLDLRNHGESAKTFDSNIEDYVSDIERFLLKKNLQRCDFIGHCLGGKFFLILAFEKPHFFQSLILVEFLPLNVPEFFKNFMLSTMRVLGDILEDLNEKGANNLQEAINICELQLVENKIKPASFRQTLTDSLIMVNGRYELTFNWKHVLRQPHVYGDIDTEGKEFSGPTLIVAAENSAVVTDEKLEKTAEILPNRSVVTLDNVSHNIQMEKPHELADECLKFWATLKR